MTVQEIVTRVRAAIDELMPNASQLFGQDSDEGNLTSIIVDKIGDALLYILENAPLYMLDNSVFDTVTEMPQATPGSTPILSEGVTYVNITKDIMSRWHVTLPNDLIRIVEARLSSWSHFPVPIPDTSQVALMQDDQYARGTWDRPVNVLTTSADGEKELMMCSAKSSNDTLVFVYIKKPSTTSYSTSDMTANVAVPLRLEAALVYHIAALAMVAFKEDATGLFQIADRYMNINTGKEADNA